MKGPHPRKVVGQPTEGDRSYDRPNRKRESRRQQAPNSYPPQERKKEPSRTPWNRSQLRVRFFFLSRSFTSSPLSVPYGRQKGGNTHGRLAQRTPMLIGGRGWYKHKTFV